MGGLLTLVQLEKKISLKTRLFHCFYSATFEFFILMLVASRAQDGCCRPGHYACLQDRKIGKWAEPVIFLLLLSLLYRSKICPRRTLAYFHLRFIGHSCVTWSARLPGKLAARASIWLSRTLGKKQQEEWG